MSKFRQLVITSSKFIAVILALCFLYLFAKSFLHQLKIISPEISAAIIGGMATVFGGLIIVMITQTKQRQLSNEQAHRSKKIELYEKFISTVVIQVAGNEEYMAKLSGEQLGKIFFDYKIQLMLRGGPNVIKKHLEFEKNLKSDNPNSTFLSTDNLFKAIREDIGLSNTSLKKLELFELMCRIEDRDDLKGI